MQNPHKNRVQVGGDRSRSIFGTPAHFVTLEQEWQRNWSYSSPPPFDASCGPVYDWLIENVGEEWVDWAASLDECHGGWPRRSITLAFKDETKALFTVMRWGKVTPSIIYYEPWYSMMKSGAPK